MTTKNKRARIEDLQTTSEGLCMMAEILGYRERWGQLQCKNGAYVSSLLNFFDDNPGAVEALFEWVLDNDQDRDGESLEEEDDDDSEENDEPEGDHVSE